MKKRLLLLSLLAVMAIGAWAQRTVDVIDRGLVAEKVTEEQVNKLMAGVEIEPNVMTRPCIVNILLEEEERTVLEFIIKEGKNRQIRRMCAERGVEILRLTRIAIGEIRLEDLAPGKYRLLNRAQINYLKDAARKFKSRTEKGTKRGERK